MANKNLPAIILGVGALILAGMFAFGKKATAQAPATNPDPVNHPDAILTGGVWRDSTHYYNALTRVWVLLSGTTQTPVSTGTFDIIMPGIGIVNNRFAVSNWMRLTLRVTQGYEAVNVGQTIILSHIDYAGKAGAITKKYVGEDKWYYMEVNIPWNMLSKGNVQNVAGIPYNLGTGQFTLQ